MSIRGLETSYIYNHLNKSSTLSNSISSIIVKGQTLTYENLEEALVIIMKNFKYPLKYKVMEDFKAGKILIKYSDNVKLPSALPFFLTKINGEVVAVVVASTYGVMDKDTGFVKIDPKKLYCMMEGAYLAKLIFFNANKIPSRPSIITHGSNIYSMMFTRVLNKKYALNTDKTKFHKLLMLSSKFYMINILGNQDNESVFNYAIKNCPNGNIYSLKEANSLFDVKYFENFETFITGLIETKALGLNLRDLTVRGYLESFINMYDASNLLSLESFPYLMYNIMAVTNGAFMNNQYVLEDIVGTSGAKMYTDLLQVDK